MPAIVACAACNTKLKVPENTTAKALRCPKCKAAVPLAPPKPPPKEEEFEVHEAADEQEEEFEVNEAAAEQEEEFEVNEAADEEEADEVPEKTFDKNSPLAKLGFVNVKNPYKKGSVPDDAKQAIEKLFVKKEMALWAGRPSRQIIESKAWIGFVVGPFLVLLGCGICLGLALIPIDHLGAKLAAVGVGFVFALMFSAVGVLAVVFRKRIGGNVEASYVLTNKRAYIYDGKAVRAFTPQQLYDMNCQFNNSFPDAGDLVFAYDFHGEEGVMVDRHGKEKYGGGKAVGFLNIEQVELVKRVVEEVLIEPSRKKKKKKKSPTKNKKLFG